MKERSWKKQKPSTASQVKQLRKIIKEQLEGTTATISATFHSLGLVLLTVNPTSDSF